MKQKFEPRFSRDELYKLYVKERWPAQKIADIHGVSESLIRWYLKRYGIPRRRGPYGIEPKLNNETNLAYVLGVLLSDGGVYSGKYSRKNEYRILLQVRSERFARKFHNALRKLNLNPHIWSFNRNGKWWVVKAISRRFIEWYSTLNIEKIKEIICSSKENTCVFLKGFYEGDGCLHKIKRKRRTYYYIEFPNTDRKIIRLLTEALHELGFDTSIRECKKKIVFLDRSWECVEYRVCLLGGIKTTCRFLELTNPVIKNPIRVGVEDA